MSKKLIGVTCNYLNPLPSAFEAGIGAEDQAWQLIAHDYLEAIWKAGAIPILIPVVEDAERALELLERVDGLLLSGGNDVSPQLYGTRVKHCGILNPERDRMEMSLLKKALSKNMPVLAVCRGVQLMNVCMGGTLYQDLPSEGFPVHSIFSNLRNIPTHRVTVTEESLLAEIIGSGETWVNSFHHQAVDQLGTGLEAAAVSEDGVVEAITMPDKKFVLAVQWHPEMMFDSEKQQKIFQSFIKACD